MKKQLFGILAWIVSITLLISRRDHLCQRHERNYYKQIKTYPVKTKLIKTMISDKDQLIQKHRPQKTDRACSATSRSDSLAAISLFKRAEISFPST